LAPSVRKHTEVVLVVCMALAVGAGRERDKKQQIESKG